MIFNSLSFFIFLLIVLVFSRCPFNWIVKKVGFLCFSLFFYSLWQPKYLFLIGFSIVIDYFICLKIRYTNNQRNKKILLSISLVSNLGLLAVFKYSYFFAETLNGVLPWLLDEEFAEKFKFILPIGISFYTFQTLSYTIDCYRQKKLPEHNFLDFALYVSFFPQLVAGPIVRAGEFLSQLQKEPIRKKGQVSFGITLLIVGLFQKVVLADQIFAPLADAVFGAPNKVSAMDTVIGAICFSGQILCDFAGYSTLSLIHI